jgi:hypothetical protein
MIRILALVTGCSIIGAVCHANVTVAGGYLTPSAPLQVALALGLAVGAVAIGRAWSSRRWALSAFLALAMIAGEGWALVGTAERTIGARDAFAAPVRDVETARIAATQRLAAAETVKREADAAVLSEAAKSGCKKECATLLRESVAAAERKIEAARSALDAFPAARSSSPLADRIGWHGWQIDLLVAALASLAANGLGAGLVMFSAHEAGLRRRTANAILHVPMPEAAAPAASAPRLALPPVVPTQTAEAAVRKAGTVDQSHGPGPEGDVVSKAINPREHAAHFALAHLVPDANGRVSLKELEAAYGPWCQATRVPPLAAGALAQAFAELVRSAPGLSVAHVSGEPVIVGARRLERPALAA